MTKIGGAAGNEGSSSNADSPRSRSAVENAPRGRGAAPRPRPSAALTPPPVPTPPQAPHWSSPPGSSGHAGAGDVAGAGAGAGVVGVGGSPPGRKRRREDGEAAAAAAEGGGGDHRCSLCPNVYQSMRALFGHMRSHPDRGWKGVYPPPAFSAAEEFADLRVDDPPEEADEGAAAPDAGEKNYRVPDLNRSPPQDDA